MYRVIVDASVGAKWLFKEDLSEKADFLLQRAIKNEIEIIVPVLFYNELANIAWMKTKRRMSSYPNADEALNRIDGFPLKIYPDRELYDVAFENAFRLNISAYDGLYIALAEIYVSPLITTDEDLLKACRGKFDFIESLAEFKLSR